MRPPRARPAPDSSAPSGTSTKKGKKAAAPQNRTHNAPRAPRAFLPETVEPDNTPRDWTEKADLSPETLDPPKPSANWPLRLALGTGGILVSLALSLWLDQLIRTLFARYQWLGWAAIGVLILFVFGLILFVLRETGAILRLKRLQGTRNEAARTLTDNDPARARRVLDHLFSLYARRPDLARARTTLAANLADQFDGADMIRTAERDLMAPLDEKARALIAATARRVALVTAISPRALVDMAFVTFESLRLARQIAQLYGARPGIMGSMRLSGAVLGHLAITGGIALGDSVIQQMLGHGLASRLSARLGEGLVNGLMSVRVGIAAMQVTRPLPFDQVRQPGVMDFAADLARITSQKGDKTPNERETD